MGQKIIFWVFAGLVASWLTSRLMVGRGYGPIMDFVAGLVGAIAGGFLMSHFFGGGPGDLFYSVVVAGIGAVVLTVLLRLIARGRFRNI
jgi:uncharacterized membrane protein YeaQ/YmgE (transglycosylase-associated protein family)